jgi:hypothetical protein
MLGNWTAAKGKHRARGVVVLPANGVAHHDGPGFAEEGWWNGRTRVVGVGKGVAIEVQIDGGSKAVGVSNVVEW